MTDFNIEQVISQASEKFGVDSALIKAVIHQESAGNPNAVSSKNAQGLMQLIPGTAKEMGVTDPFDPTQNIMGGVKYLSQQLQKFGSVPLALAAYNAGPGAVRKHGGIPPYKETQDYVKRITSRLAGGSSSSVSSPTEAKVMPDEQFSSVLQKAEESYLAGNAKQINIQEQMQELLQQNILNTQKLTEAKSRKLLQDQAASAGINEAPIAHLAKMTEHLMREQENLITSQQNAYQFAVDANSNPANWLLMHMQGNPYQRTVDMRQQNIEQISAATKAVAESVQNAYDMSNRLVTDAQIEIEEATGNLLLDSIQEKIIESKGSLGEQDQKTGKFYLDLAQAISTEGNRQEQAALREFQIRETSENRALDRAARAEIASAQLEQRAEIEQARRDARAPLDAARTNLIQAQEDMLYSDRADKLANDQRDFSLRIAQEERKVAELALRATTAEQKAAAEQAKAELETRKQAFKEKNSGELLTLKQYAENRMDAGRALKERQVVIQEELAALEKEKFSSAEDKEAAKSVLQERLLDLQTEMQNHTMASKDRSFNLEVYKELRRGALKNLESVLMDPSLDNKQINAAAASILDMGLKEMGSAMSGAALLSTKSTKEGSFAIRTVHNFLNSGQLAGNSYDAIVALNFPSLIDPNSLPTGTRQTFDKLQEIAQALPLDPKVHPLTNAKKINDRITTETIKVDKPSESIYGAEAPITYKMQLAYKGNTELVTWMEQSGIEAMKLSPLDTVAHIYKWFKDEPKAKKEMLVADYFKAVVEGNNRTKNYKMFALPEQKNFQVPPKSTALSSVPFLSANKFDLTNPEDVSKFFFFSLGGPASVNLGMVNIPLR